MQMPMKRLPRHREQGEKAWLTDNYNEAPFDLMSHYDLCWYISV